MTRLKTLASSDNQKIAELAAIVLEVAWVRPYKKRRLTILAEKRTGLLEKLEESGLIFAHQW